MKQINFYPIFFFSLLNVFSYKGAYAENYSDSFVGFSEEQALELSASLIQDVSCNGGDDGFAFVIAAGGLPPYSYLWSNGLSTNIAANLTAGNYSVTVTDLSGNTASLEVDISEPPLLACPVIEWIDISCIDNTGSAAVEPQGGTPPYSLHWSTGDTGTTIDGLAPGLYSYTLTDDNACIFVSSVLIVENLAAPVITATTPPAINCQQPQVTLQAELDGSGNNFIMEWSTADGQIISGSGSLNNCVVDASGTYTLTVEDTGNGCSSSTEVFVEADLEVPVATIATSGSGDLMLDCLTPELTLDGSLSTQGADITYNWSTADGNIVSGSASQDNCVVDASGTYTLTVEDTGNGCSSSTEVFVEADLEVPVATIAASGSGDLMLDCLTPELTLDGSLSTQGADITYNWSTADGQIVSGSGSLNNCVVDASGTYTLTVEDTGNGCSSSTEVFVEADLEVPVATIAASGSGDLMLDCLTPELTLDGSLSTQGADITYNWSTADGNIVSGSASQDNCVVDASGTYTLTVEDTGNGCSSSTEVFVEADLEVPVATIAASGSGDLMLDCLTPELTLDGSLSTQGADITYNWSTADGNIVSGSASQDNCVVDASGTYTLTVEDMGNGCSSSTEVFVESDLEVPVATIAASGSGDLMLDCLTPELTLDGSLSTQGADITYNWSTADGNIVSGSASQDNCVVDASGTYTLTVEDTGNGCSSSTEVFVSQDNDLPSVSILANGTLDCSTPTILLDASSSSQGSELVFEWSTGNGNILSGQGTAMIVVDAPGEYTLTIENAISGCSSDASVSVDGQTSLDAFVESQSNVSCAGAADGSVNIALNGAPSEVSFNWSNGMSGPALSSLAGGNYTVTVSTAGGCVSEVEVVVEEPAPLELEIEVDNATNIFANDGSISCAISGGVPPFSWTVNGNISSESLLGLQPGVYAIVVTDAQGCSASETVVLGFSPLDCNLSVAADVTHASCGQDGQVSLAVEGGAAPYSFDWSTGAAGSSISGLSGGTYTVSISDSQNCGLVAFIELFTEGEDMIPPVAVATDVTVELSVAGPTLLSPDMIDGGSFDNCSEVDLSVDPGQFDCSDLGTRQVTLSVTDAFGNQAQAVANVTIVDTQGPLMDCPESIVLSGCSAGTTDAMPVVSDACNFELIQLEGPCDWANLPIGVHTVSYAAIDASGNAGYCSFEITVVPENLDYTLEVDPPTCSGSADGSIEVEMEGDITGWTILIAGEQTHFGASATELSAGVYQLIALHTSGCALKETIHLEAPDPLEVMVAEVIAESDGGSNGQIHLNVSGGTPPYQYEWTLNGWLISTQEDLLNISAGSYEVRITDAGGCEVTAGPVQVSGFNTPGPALNGQLADNGALQATIEASPNPSPGIFQIDLRLNRLSEGHIEVFDVNGLKVLDIPASRFVDKNFRLDLSDQRQGIYYLKAIAEGSIFSHRLTVVKP